MKNRALMPVFWVMLLDIASYTIRFPVLTLIFFDATTRIFSPGTLTPTRSYWYGICMSCYWIGMLVASPILSTCSDYIGRKRILIIGGLGTLLFAAFTVLGIILGEVRYLIIGALVGGVFSRMDPVAQAAVGDVSSGEQKILNMSYLQLFISIGGFFGPIIGGYFAQRFFFAQLNFALPFIIAGLLSLLGVIVILLFYRETAPVKPATKFKFFYDFKEILQNKKVLAISVALVLIQSSWSMYYQFIAPVLKKSFAFGGTEIGFFMGFIAFWLALGSAFGFKLLQRHFSIQQIFYYSCLAIFVGILLNSVLVLWHPSKALSLLNWVIAIPIAIGDVITYCAITAMYSDAVAADMQGQVMGVNYIVISLVWALTALIGGALLAHLTVGPLLFALFGVGMLIILFSGLAQPMFAEK